jgi:hypothetical protein
MNQKIDLSNEDHNQFRVFEPDSDDELYLDSDDDSDSDDEN